jgi:hypothetical protein
MPGQLDLLTGADPTPPAPEGDNTNDEHEETDQS